MPPLSDDDALDFMVVEAMTVKVRALRKKEQEKAQSKQRRGSHKDLRGLKPGDPIPGAT